jgi:hypothetical protein
MRRWMQIPSLDESSTTYTNEPRAQVRPVLVTDGPYAETKELLGSRARPKPKPALEPRAVRALMIVALTSSAATACAGGHPTPQQELRQAGVLEPHVEALIARARVATAPYRVLDSAVAAGYAQHVAQCVENQPLGAMGYHHVNRALLDDSLDVERPEILVYGRDGGGAYKLNGVEYIVPYRVRPPDAEAPRVMGQTLKRADDLRLWYLHVWLWEPNPSGIFADWNPAVRC